MKKIQITTGIFILLFLAGNAPLDAQRGMRGMRMDSARIQRMDSMRIGRMGMRSDTAGARFFRPGMGPGWDWSARRGMGPMWNGPMWNGPMSNRMYMWNSPMGRGMGPAWMGPVRRNMGPAWWGPAWWGPAGRGFDSVNVNRMRHNRMGMRSFLPDSIPGLTAKQKAAIHDLRLKNQDEMKKFREDMASKMQSMREEHRKNMMNLLTPEQKKWVESRYPGMKGK